MLYESIKVHGNTTVMIPSETLNSMGFGNLGMTLAYLENTKKAAAQSQLSAAASSKDSNKDNG
jgi:hypothetical protein